MGREDYENVIKRFCKSAGIDDVADVLHRGMLKIGPRSFSLQYFEETEHCKVCVDLGLPPAGKEFAIYRMMLESNFVNEADSLPVLSVHPDSGHIVLKMHLPIARLISDVDLHELITAQMKDVVAQWHASLEQIESERHTASASGPTLFA